MTTERHTTRDFLRAVSKMPNVRVFRNNVGVGLVGNFEKFEAALIATFGPVLGERVKKLILRFFRRIRFGLTPGSGDYIGWESVVITPDMVGKRVAIFRSYELKSETGSASERQKNWRDQVRAFGGIAEIIKPGGMICGG